MTPGLAPRAGVRPVLESDGVSGWCGLAPVMGDRQMPGCVILLGDASRQEEREISERWDAELGATSEVLGHRKPYIRLTVGHEMLNGADLH